MMQVYGRVFPRKQYVIVYYDEDIKEGVSRKKYIMVYEFLNMLKEVVSIKNMF